MPFSFSIQTRLHIWRKSFLKTLSDNHIKTISLNIHSAKVLKFFNRVRNNTYVLFLTLLSSGYKK